MKYTKTARILHWLMALGILGLLALGWILADMPRGPEKLALMTYHKEFGVLVLLLALYRLAHRRRNPAPELPADTPEWSRRASSLMHVNLYALMLLTPAVGAAASLGFKGIDFFGLKIPALYAAPLPVLKGLMTLHGLFAIILGISLMLHVLAVLWHQFVRKDRLLSRML